MCRCVKSVFQTDSKRCMHKIWMRHSDLIGFASYMHVCSHFKYIYSKIIFDLICGIDKLVCDYVLWIYWTCIMNLLHSIENGNGMQCHATRDCFQNDQSDCIEDLISKATPFRMTSIRLCWHTAKNNSLCICSIFGTIFA